MLSQQLKGLLTCCPDKTDLPTTAMIMAGVEVLNHIDYSAQFSSGEFSKEETVQLIWEFMWDEFRQGNTQEIIKAEA